MRHVVGMCCVCEEPIWSDDHANVGWLHESPAREDGPRAKAERLYGTRAVFVGLYHCGVKECVDWVESNRKGLLLGDRHIDDIVPTLVRVLEWYCFSAADRAAMLDLIMSEAIYAHGGEMDEEEDGRSIADTRRELAAYGQTHREAAARAIRLLSEKRDDEEEGEE